MDMAKSTQQAPLQFLCFTLILLSWQSIKPVQSAKPGEHVEYDYEEKSQKGPPKWGSLKSEWSICKGTVPQSPINLSNARAKKEVAQPTDLITSYKAAPAILKHEAHDMTVHWEGDAGWIRVNGATQYYLNRGHWHKPAEHTINGKKFDAELHMVHISKDNKIAVVGYLFQAGNPNPFLTKINKDITAIATKQNMTKLGTTDPNLIKAGPSGARYYRYVGSLTVPPCTGGVIWTVHEEPLTISKEQLAMIYKVDGGENERPAQPLQNRTVVYYTVK